jgi:hypothetical protein
MLGQRGAELRARILSQRMPIDLGFLCSLERRGWKRPWDFDKICWVGGCRERMQRESGRVSQKRIINCVNSHVVISRKR